MRNEILQKYQLIIRNSHELIIFFDKEGYIIDMNTEAYNQLGYQESFKNISITDILKKEIYKDGDQLVIDEKYMNGTKEAIIYRKNQTCFSVNLRIGILEDDNQYLGICTAMDISKIKELTRENRMMNKELNNSGTYKNEFIANVTHELKTPINGIQGMVDTLMETELSPKQLEIVNIIHRCCRNMTAIITDILDFSKIKNNKMELEYREFSFHEFIENIKTMNQKRISKKGLRFLVNIADDVPDRVIGDELRLSQVLNNLISNAIKFTSVGQIILGVMKTEETNREVELIFMVTDTGIGISEDEMDKLFISFSQVDGTITRRFGGTGLGLSICKMLIELMKGHITVISEKNKGSSFSFTIRLGVPEQDTTAANDKENDLYNIKEVEIHLIKEKSNKLLEEDYISKFLDKLDKTLFEADKYDNGGKGTSLENSSGVSKICSELIEKMIICIELECWEQAERLAEQLKRILAKQNITIGQKAFRLLLAVRREDYKTSLLLANELKEMNTKTHGQSNI